MGTVSGLGTITINYQLSIISGLYAYLRWCPEYALALAPQEDPTQTDPPGSHAVRTASHKVEGFVGFCTVERCYQPMVVFLSPEVEITDLTVVHTCTRGSGRMPGMLLAPNGGSGGDAARRLRRPGNDV